MPAPSARRPDRLPRLHGTLARERDAFLDALAGLAAEARTTRPAPGAWSPLEIAEHVFRVERAMLHGLEKQLDAGDARKAVGARSAVRVAALLAAMRMPKRIRVPERARGIAPEGMAYEALREAWSSLGARWHAASASAPGELEPVPLLKHPLGVALTRADALRFLVAHAARHRRQLARTLRELGVRPGSA